MIIITSYFWNIYAAFDYLYEDQSKGFGLFATSGKLTSFLGPVLVSTLTFVSGSQRIGFSAAIFLLIIGLILLFKIKNLD